MSSKVHSARHIKTEPNMTPGWVYFDHEYDPENELEVTHNAYPLYFWHYLDVTFVKVDDNQMESTYTRPVAVPSHSVKHIPSPEDWDDLNVLHHPELYTQAQCSMLDSEPFSMPSDYYYGSFADRGMKL